MAVKLESREELNEQIRAAQDEDDASRREDADERSDDLDAEVGDNDSESSDDDDEQRDDESIVIDVNDESDGSDSDDDDSDDDSENDTSDESSSDEDVPLKALPKKLRRIVRNQSKAIKELDRERAELRQQLEHAKAQRAQADEDIGNPPASLDYDKLWYDLDGDNVAYAKAIRDHEKAVAAHEAKKQIREERERERARIQAEKDKAIIDQYNDEFRRLKAPDAIKIDQKVGSRLNPMQRAILLRKSKHPGFLTYGIGKNDMLLESLAAIDDPVDFAMEIGRIESKIKIGSMTTKKKSKPKPQTIVRASGSAATSKDEDLLRKGTDQSVDQYLQARRRRRIEQRMREIGS